MIICPKCSNDKSEQFETRQRPNTLYVYRRRICKNCGYKFTTREYRLEDLSKLVTEESDLVADQVTEIVEDLIDG
tara:strand:+ start:336 stop:560 length:225 start_codon:yes stop_codon:yes gene_type:complete